MAECAKGVYRPRRPRETAFYRLVEEHYQRFEQVYPERYEDRYGFFRPVIRETVYKYLGCGDLKQGFAWVRCRDCGHEYHHKGRDLPRPRRPPFTSAGSASTPQQESGFRAKLSCPDYGGSLCDTYKRPGATSCAGSRLLFLQRGDPGDKESRTLNVHSQRLDRR